MSLSIYKITDKGHNAIDNTILVSSDMGRVLICIRDTPQNYRDLYGFFKTRDYSMDSKVNKQYDYIMENLPFILKKIKEDKLVTNSSQT